MTPNEQMVAEIKARQEKLTEFNSGILTADKYVQSIAECCGSDMCYRFASKGNVSFSDILKKSAKTLTYNNPDMVVEDVYGKSYEWTDNDGDALELPKNTLMVFKHVLTTPRKDRDGDILRTEGAQPDPKMLLLWQHVATLPIGKMLKVHERNSKRLVNISAVIDMNDLSHDAAVMIDNKMGRFSHGFRALEFTKMKGSNGMEGGFDVASFEIMEESLVSIPSNTDADTLEVLVSLTEGGKLTSPLMKEAGKSARSRMNKRVSVEIDVKSLEGNHAEEHGTKQGCTGNESCSCGCGKPHSPKEADLSARDEGHTEEKKMMCPKCDGEMHEGVCKKCGYSGKAVHPEDKQLEKDIDEQFEDEKGGPGSGPRPGGGSHGHLAGLSAAHEISNLAHTTSQNAAVHSNCDASKAALAHAETAAKASHGADSKGASEAHGKAASEHMNAMYNYPPNSAAHVLHSTAATLHNSASRLHVRADSYTRSVEVETKGGPGSGPRPGGGSHGGHGSAEAQSNAFAIGRMYNTVAAEASTASHKAIALTQSSNAPHPQAKNLIEHASKQNKTSEDHAHIRSQHEGLMKHHLSELAKSEKGSDNQRDHAEAYSAHSTASSLHYNAEQHLRMMGTSGKATEPETKGGPGSGPRPGGGGGGGGTQITSNNDSFGFYRRMHEHHGGDEGKAQAAFHAAASAIVEKHGVSPEVARNYLDSVHGRHVGGYMKDGHDIHSAMKEHHASDAKLKKALKEIQKQTEEGWFDKGAEVEKKEAATDAMAEFLAHADRPMLERMKSAIATIEELHTTKAKTKATMRALGIKGGPGSGPRPGSPNWRPSNRSEAVNEAVIFSHKLSKRGPHFDNSASEHARRNGPGAGGENHTAAARAHLERAENISRESSLHHDHLRAARLHNMAAEMSVTPSGDGD